MSCPFRYTTHQAFRAMRLLLPKILAMLGLMCRWQIIGQAKPRRRLRYISLITNQLLRLWLKSWAPRDRKSTRLNSSHVAISYAVFCLQTKTEQKQEDIETATTA